MFTGDFTIEESNPFSRKHPDEFAFLKEFIDEYQQEYRRQMFEYDSRGRLPLHWISSAAHILASREADNGATALLAKIIQEGYKKAEQEKTPINQEQAEQDRARKMIEELVQKLSRVQAKIKKDIIKSLKIDKFEYGEYCYNEGYAKYFSPDVEASMKLLRPVWTCNSSLSREDLNIGDIDLAADTASIIQANIKESSTYEAFEFLLRKMEIKGKEDERKQKEKEFLEAFRTIIDVLLTSKPGEKIQSVNTNGVYVEAMQSRCTACEPYYEDMRELEVQAKSKEIEEKSLKNEQTVLINKLIKEEKITPPITETPENVTVTTNVNVDGDE